MDEHRKKMDETTLCGIKVDHWRRFLKAFQESTTDVEAEKVLDKLRESLQQASLISSPRAASVLRILTELEALLKSDFPSS